MRHRSHVLTPFIAFAALYAASTSATLGQTYSFTTFDYEISPTFVTGINNRGEVVGYGEDPNFDVGFIYDPRTNTFTRITVPDSPRTHLRGINDRGDILGWAYDPFRAFLYRKGAFTPILYSYTLAINNRGDMVGGFVDYDSPGTEMKVQGFIFDGKTTQTIDYPGSVDTWLTGINDRGQVIGQYMTSELTSSTRSFLWDRGTYIPLDIPGESRVTGINNRGEIVGTYDGYCASQDVTGGLGFVYYRGSYTCFVVPDAINEQPGGRFAATFPTGVNDRGQIAGYFYDRTVGDTIRGFIGTPERKGTE
jgi:hypothetical protein